MRVNADTRTDVSDYSDSESSNSDSDVPTSLCKQLRSSVVVVTSDSETSIEEEESSEPESSEDKVTYGVKLITFIHSFIHLFHIPLILYRAMSLFLEPQV